MKAVRFAVPLVALGLFLAPARSEACSLCASGPFDGSGIVLVVGGVIGLSASAITQVSLDLALATDVSNRLETTRALAIANIVLSAVNLAGGIAITVLAATSGSELALGYGGTVTGIAAFSLGYSIWKLVHLKPGAAPSQAVAASEGFSPWVSRSRDGLTAGLAFSKRW